MESIDFDRLFVFEMANNHMGSVDHGLRIIREIYEVSKDFDFNFGFKLQYRDLDTFIHPAFKERKDIKYVKRFLETKLSALQLKVLKDEITRLGFKSICTPFDERSVDLVEEHDFDIIKIASCSFTDWPLLERVVKTDKPLIASTAGATLEVVDNVVSFLQHRNKKFCLMHCVGEYPTKRENLKLNRIDLFRNRYLDTPIGYSTHEEPDNIDSVKIAIGKGATVFEKHVGIQTDTFPLNQYSSNPEQIRHWLDAARDAFAMCGTEKDQSRFTEKELLDLRSLQRGVFAKTNLKRDSAVGLDDVFLAIPTTENQLLANDLSKYTEFILTKDIRIQEPILRSNVTEKKLREKVLEIVKRIKKILAEAKIAVSNRVDLEISHHYGIDSFYEYGAVIINIVNREYCKKLIILLPNQSHPSHAHRLKEETFHVLYGSASVVINEKEHQVKAGDLLVVERGMKHSFSTKDGVIFEEISTTHHKGDSYYSDVAIMKNKKRKTEVTYWLDVAS